MKKNFKVGGKIEKEEMPPTELVPMDISYDNDYTITMQYYQELLQHSNDAVRYASGIPPQEVKTVSVKLIKKKLDGNTVIMMCTEEGFPCGIYTKQSTTRDKESESDITIEIPISNSKVRELFDEPKVDVIFDIIKTINAAHGHEEVDNSNDIIYNDIYNHFTGYNNSGIIYKSKSSDFMKDFLDKIYKDIK